MAARVKTTSRDKSTGSKDDERVAGKRASMNVEVPGSSLTYSEVD